MADERRKPVVVQVTNISPNITEDQIKHFLEYVGRVKETKLYPEGDGDPNQTKVAYVRYESSEHVEVALHLTNTVMVDRALILVPYPDENIPDEMKALRVAAPMSTVAGMLPPTLEWPSNVVNMVCGSGSSQTIHTIDPKLIELGLPQYPNLPSKTDPSKVEEIRRTIYVSNLDPAVNAEQLVQFFSQAGEVMYVRMAGDENLPSKNAYVEFTSQRSVPMALAYNGVLMNNRHLKCSHSVSAIENKPQTQAQELLSKEIDEAMKKFKDVEHLIHSDKSGSKNSKRGRSRTRSRERRRHKSKERRKSRERKRSLSPRKSSRRSSRERKKRSRSRERRRSRSRERKRSRSRDKERKRSRSKDKERKRSRSKDKERKRSRSKDKERKRSRSKDKERKRSRSKDKERKRSRSRDKKRERSRDRRRRSKSRDKSRRSRSRGRDRDRERRNRSRRSTSKDKDRVRSRDESRKSKENEEKNGVKVKRDYDAEEKDMNDGPGKTVKENGDQEVEMVESVPNGTKNDVSDEESEVNDTSTDLDKSVAAVKSQDPMAALEKAATGEAMEIDTGDDSDA